jgi:hypothetical protein
MPPVSARSDQAHELPLGDVEVDLAESAHDVAAGVSERLGDPLRRELRLVSTRLAHGHEGTLELHRVTWITGI